jgi:hypothetical protein
VAGRLAARHGVTAELRTPRAGGTEAVVVVPAALLPSAPPTVSPVHTLATPGAPWLSLPGVVAEANEHTLPPRVRPGREPLAAEPLAAEHPETAAAGPAVAPLFQSPQAEAPAPEAPAAGSEAAPAVAPLFQAPVFAAPATEPLPGPDLAALPEPLDEPLPGPDLAALPEPGPAPAAEAVPPADQVFTVPAPAAPAAPAEPTTPGPADELLARVVPDAPARVVPDTDPVADVPAPEADPHRHAPAEDANWVPRQGSHPEAVTDKGLPKRTPRTVAAGRADAVRPEPRRVDAEELRRRLGGFYQGTQDGRRVVAAELAQEQHAQPEPAEPHRPRAADRLQGQGHTDQGDTAQEART